MPWRRVRKWRYTPTNFYLGTRYKWVVSFMLWPPYPQWKSLRACLNTGIEKNLFLLSRIKPWQSSQLLYQPSYPGSTETWGMQNDCCLVSGFRVYLKQCYHMNYCVLYQGQVLAHRIVDGLIFSSESYRVRWCQSYLLLFFTRCIMDSKYGLL
jgi:hypothetical protein